MQNPQDDLWKRRLAAAAAALLVAYAAHPLTSFALLMLEGFGVVLGGAFMPIQLTVQAVVFGLALVWQLKMPSISRSFESAALCAGICMLLAIPAVILLAFVEVAKDTSVDQGGATASFFMVIIFGGYYGIQGLALLIAGLVMRKRRKNAPPPLSPY